MLSYSKYFCCLAVFFVMLVNKASAQKIINEHFENVPMSLILDSIGKKYNIKFSYDYKLLKGVSVSGNYNNLSESEFIRKITRKYKFDVRKMDNVYLIKPRKTKTQAYVLSGIVIDGKTKERLPYATVCQKYAQSFSVTNPKGYFTLFAEQKDTIALQISYMGYKTKNINIIELDTLSDIVIELENEDKRIKKVDVKRNKIKSVEISQMSGHFTVNPSKLANLPVLGEPDIFRNLQLFPGISGSGNSSSGLIVRYSPPDQTMVNFDGLTILDLDHFFGMFSAINSKVVKDIQIYKGGFEAKYGNRVSSVVEITGKSGDLTKPAVHFNLNMISANLVVELPLFKKASLLIAARRSYNDLIKTPLYEQLFGEIKSPVDKNYWLINGTLRYMPYQLEPHFNFFDVNVKLNIPLHKNSNLSISYFQSQDKLNFLDSLSTGLNFYQTEEKMNWGNFGLGVNWTKKWSKKLYSSLLLSVSSYYNNYSSYYAFINEQASDTSTSYQSNYIDNLNFKWSNSWYINKKNTFEFGIDNNAANIDYFNGWDTYDLQNINQFVNQLSVYAQNTVNFNKKIRLIAGVRANILHPSKNIDFEPRLAFMYRFIPSLTFKMSGGRFHQYLNKIPIKDVAGINRAFWVVSDYKFLPPVEANHLILGLKFERKAFTIDVEAYYKEAMNLVEYEGPFLSKENFELNGFTGIYHRGIGKIAGVDFLMMKTFGNYTGWISYTFGKSIRKFLGINRGVAFPDNNDQRHELKLVNMYKLKNWNFSLTWTYGSGKPYTEPEGQYYIKLLNGEQKLVSVPSKKNSSRLPAFHSLDMSVNYDFRIGQGFAKVGLSVFNLYGRQNIKYRFYRVLTDEGIDAGNQPVYKVYDIKLLGFTPNLFISFDF